jgi:hypothetical protein
MSQRLWRLVVSHPANVISVAVFFGMLLAAFATIETRLMPDRFSGYVRGIFGFGFIVLFCYTAVAGAVYLLRIKVAAAASCLLTAGALYGSYIFAQGAGYDIMDCRVRFRDQSEIDWQYVRQEVAENLNRRKHPRPFIKYTRKLSASDIVVVRGVDPFNQSLSRPLSFTFRIPEYAPEISGMVDRCGAIEVW